MAETPEVEAVANMLMRQYASEYNADHLSWRDFEDQAAEVVAALDLDGVVRKAKAEALREAAAEVFLLDCTGSTRVKDLTAGEQEWFHGHPMASAEQFDEPRNATAKWLNAEADRIGGEG